MIDAVIFDLDNTLYPADMGLFSLIDVRINRYMEEVVGIPAAEVDGLRRRYWKEYGVTLQGLIRHWGADPEEYLEYVHDVDVSERLRPDPVLKGALEALPLRKVVFTNGSRGHAQRVLGALGLSEQFEQIFDIRVAGYLPKPFAEPFHRVLEAVGVAAGRCVMVEDSAENLRTAKNLGMGTVLVGEGDLPDYVDVQIPVAAHIGGAMQRWPRKGV